jgi:glycosyltransferase involved in cell wall biosynthesis
MKKMHEDRLNVRVLLWHLGQKGAAAKFTFNLLAELNALGGTAFVVSSALGSDLDKLTRGRMDISTDTVSTFEGEKSTLRGRLAAVMGLAGLPKIAYQFNRLLSKNRIDLALCTFQSIWDAATLPALMRGPVHFILILHDAFFHPGDEYPVRHFVLRQQIDASDALIVLSDHVRRQAIEAFNYPPERIWLMPHAAFSYGSEQAHPAKHPRGTCPVRLVFFGRIIAYKGLDHLLRAFRLLRQKGSNVELVIAGSGSLEPYASLMENLPNIELHNRWLEDEEIGTIVQSCDIVVLPYIEASQSGVAATAYAAGLPIIATPIGGLVEQVIDGYTGALAKDMTVEALSDAITRFVDDPGLLDRCACNALAHARGELSWAKSAEVVADAIKSVRAVPRRRQRR